MSEYTEVYHYSDLSAIVKNLPAQPYPLKITGMGLININSVMFYPQALYVHPTAEMNALDSSMETLGLIDCIIVSKNSGYLLDGWARVMVASHRNQTVLPALFVDLTPDEEMAALIALNSLSKASIPDSALPSETVMLNNGQSSRRLTNKPSNFDGIIVQALGSGNARVRAFVKQLTDSRIVSFTIGRQTRKR